MQTNILDWLEATSARCPDAPAVGDEQTDWPIKSSMLLM